MGGIINLWTNELMDWDMDWWNWKFKGKRTEHF